MKRDTVSDTSQALLKGIELHADVLPEGVAWMIVAPRRPGETLEAWGARCVVARYEGCDE